MVVVLEDLAQGIGFRSYLIRYLDRLLGDFGWAVEIDTMIYRDAPGMNLCTDSNALFCAMLSGDEDYAC